MNSKYSRNMITMKRELKKLTLFGRSITVRKRIKEIAKLTYKNHEIYETEIQSLQSKNRILALATQYEKEGARKLEDEKLSAQRAFLDMCKENALLKSDLKEMERMITKHDQDFKNSLIPNLVKLSDDITKLMMSNSTVLTNIERRRNSINDVSFSRNSWYSRKSNGSNASQPVSTVNPMIKGCIIQKPTINVHRVSFPNERQNTLFSNVAVSSPIMEESEESSETMVNVSSRKCKNGLRHAMTASNRLASHSTLSDTSNISETLETATHSVNFLMEPTVRLQDVTQMLQNSTIQITETGNPATLSQESNLIGCSPEILSKPVPITRKTLHRASSISSENPLEGCSWMYQRTSSSPVLTIKSPAYRVCVENNPILQNIQNDDETNDSLVFKSSPTKKTTDRFEHSSPRPSLLLKNCTKRPRRSCRSSIVKTSNVDLSNCDTSSVDLSEIKTLRRSSRRSNSVDSQKNVNNADTTQENDETNKSDRHDTTQTRRRAKLFTRKSTEPDSTVVKKSTEEKRSLKSVKRKSSECNTDESLSVSSVDNNSRPKRSARQQKISYKEPSLSCKMRRSS